MAQNNSDSTRAVQYLYLKSVYICIFFSFSLSPASRDIYTKRMSYGLYPTPSMHETLYTAFLIQIPNLGMRNTN